jgi:hypothetical protein
MTGEQSASEVTPENFPELFKFKDVLENKGISCQAKPFDKYQGPFLLCEAKEGNFKVWHPPPEEVVLKGRTRDGVKIERREYIPRASGSFYIEAGMKGFEIDEYDVDRLIKKLRK